MRLEAGRRLSAKCFVLSREKFTGGVVVDLQDPGTNCARKPVRLRFAYPATPRLPPASYSPSGALLS